MNYLPVNRQDLTKRGWDELDIIFVSGDAYVDHPAWAAALLGRFLEKQGFRVGIIAQPDWQSLEDIRKLGQPRLFFAVSAAIWTVWSAIIRRIKKGVRKICTHPADRLGCVQIEPASFIPT